LSVIEYSVDKGAQSARKLNGIVPRGLAVLPVFIALDPRLCAPALRQVGLSGLIGGIISKQAGLFPFPFRTIGLRDFDDQRPHA
jgi:hypothetical protein